MVAAKYLIDEGQFSSRAKSRLRQGARRGKFRDLDAARAQQALLSVADGKGQARLFWLIDMDSMTIADARYLSFGSLASHAVMETWTEQLRGQTLDDALATDLANIEAALRDEPSTPAFGDAGLQPLDFVPDLQDRARDAIPTLRILPKPQEVERYVRKREQDWDEQDRAWLPLSLMRKIMQVQQVGQEALKDRLGSGDLRWSVDGLHDDFQVLVDFSKGEGSDTIPVEQRPTVIAFLQEAIRGRIHPAISVEEQDHG